MRNVIELHGWPCYWCGTVDVPIFPEKICPNAPHNLTGLATIVDESGTEWL